MHSLRPLLRRAAPARHFLPTTRTTIPSASHSPRAFTTTQPRPALLPPLNLPKWLSENSHLLKPPINNYCVHSDPMTVMIVGGPNARTDYHINSTPEFFYQYKGRMLLKTVQDGAFRDVYIDEGEMFLLPGNTPHNPVRFADTVGVVIEQPRPEGEVDRLRWYCQGCGEKVHEDAFVCTDLGTQIKEAVQAFEKREDLRKCSNCGEVCDVKPKPEVMEKMRTGPHPE
ncbi:3-hydroxyanthranilic acid dioxygenase-domain-containing protein [Elsinoe ampelina]|uniref:3-hydroxyanthranilate 3,4-dioxygenase n=1 Tax=Elsinoe ampelina TaxID=302913 RepID=A0A6A6G7X2_9PEZI|nr:3-hydroxyanthranilic acid dioxygenase-domain-containing protein [Elsinoe ampelina]